MSSTDRIFTPEAPDGRTASDASSLKHGPTTGPEKKRTFLEFQTPSECREFVVPPDYILVGDCHLTRGGVSVIGGVPGCGKSRIALGLAIAGATQQPWMNLDVHTQFKTMIIQGENGRVRLKSEFESIGFPDGVDLDDFIRITPIPKYGMAIADPDFRAELRAYIEDFKPGVIAFDPWNKMVDDDRQKDFKACFDYINELLPEDDRKKPAVVIVAHLRKRGGADSKKRGRDLLPELSGSGMLGSSPRSAFILEPASADGDDDRVVWTCAKNNDGNEGSSSAWHRRNGLFVPADDFDFEEFFGGESGGRIAIEGSDVAEVLKGGTTKARAAKQLQQITDCGQSAAYAALAESGRFKDCIDTTPEGLLVWIG